MSDDVKRNHENMMKCNDGIPSHHGSENEGTSFFGDSLNKNIPRKKKLGYIMKQGYTLSYSEKQVLLKRIKAATKRSSLK